MKFILGKKIEMSQLFDEKGKFVPVTLVEAGPCEVLQKKTKEKDGYDAIQIGFEKMTKEKNIKKPMKNKPFRFIREVRNDNMNIGDKIDVSVFQEGEMIKVAGISKGKGFQGAVKRWGFHGKNATHGQKHDLRTLGSIGTAGGVMKGKKMAGRMGTDRVTVKNLKIVKIDKENNLLAIRGAVPGRRGTLLEIRTCPSGRTLITS
ncbi:MAG: 50S ribosomal protein L3 [Candidatus Pacebacteria bacterium]|nr:50S ribosomal protein L3 [Candidatus Paceibacterota bacterium]